MSSNYSKFKGQQQIQPQLFSYPYKKPRYFDSNPNIAENASHSNSSNSAKNHTFSKNREFEQKNNENISSQMSEKNFYKHIEKSRKEQTEKHTKKQAENQVLYCWCGKFFKDFIEAFSHCKIDHKYGNFPLLHRSLAQLLCEDQNQFIENGGLLNSKKSSTENFSKTKSSKTSHLSSYRKRDEKFAHKSDRNVKNRNSETYQNYSEKRNSDKRSDSSFSDNVSKFNRKNNDFLEFSLRCEDYKEKLKGIDSNNISHKPLNSSFSHSKNDTKSSHIMSAHGLRPKNGGINAKNSGESSNNKLQSKTLSGSSGVDKSSKKDLVGVWLYDPNRPERFICLPENIPNLKEKIKVLRDNGWSWGKGPQAFKRPENVLVEIPQDVRNKSRAPNSAYSTQHSHSAQSKNYSSKPPHSGPLYICPACKTTGSWAYVKHHMKQTEHLLGGARCLCRHLCIDFDCIVEHYTQCGLRNNMHNYFKGELFSSSEFLEHKPYIEEVNLYHPNLNVKKIRKGVYYVEKK